MHNMIKEYFSVNGIVKFIKRGGGYFIILTIFKKNSICTIILL